MRSGRVRPVVAVYGRLLPMCSQAHVNTLLLQDVLASPGWDELLGTHELRALSPLFCPTSTPTDGSAWA